MWADKALGLANFSFEGPNQADLYITTFCGQRAPNLILQISSDVGWDYYLGTAGMNLFCQDPYVGCCKLPPPSPSLRLPVVELHRFLCNPHGVRLE